MSNKETSMDYNALAQLAFGDLEFRPVDIDEDFDLPEEGWGEVAGVVSGSIREDITYSKSLEMGVCAAEHFHLLDAQKTNEDPTVHVLIVEYEHLDFSDYVCLDKNRIIDEVQDTGYDTDGAPGRIIKALSAITDKRLGLEE